MSDPYRSGTRRRRPALIALAATGALAVATRNGIGFTPDSWGYWEASVSLLEGCGYRYLNGPVMSDWPPLTSYYLAAVQAMLGVGVQSVKVALLATFLSCVLGICQLRGALWPHRRPIAAAIAAASVSLMLVPWYGVLLSEALMLAALPWVLLELIEWRRSTDRIRPGSIIRLTSLLVAMMLARHAALALVVAAGVLIAARPRPSRIAQAIVTCGVPLVVWWLTNRTLGVRMQERADLTSVLSRIPEALGPVAVALGTLFATSAANLNIVVLVVVLAVLATASVSLFRTPHRRSSFHALLLFTIVAVAVTTAMYAAAPPTDPLFVRFVLFASIPLTLALALVADDAADRRLRILAVSVLAVLLVSQSARAAKIVWAGGAEAWGPIVPLSATISSTDQRLNSVPLPDWPWVVRGQPGSGCGR